MFPLCLSVNQSDIFVCLTLEYCSHMRDVASSTSFSIHDQVYCQAIWLIVKPSLTSALQPLAHRRKVFSLSFFCLNYVDFFSLEFDSNVTIPAAFYQVLSCFFALIFIPYPDLKTAEHSLAFCISTHLQSITWFLRERCLTSPLQYFLPWGLSLILYFALCVTESSRVKHSRSSQTVIGG